MARYTGPKSKIARKFGEPIYGPDKALERRNYPSGQHGLARRRRKISEYGVQLKEKQKAKYTYGLCHITLNGGICNIPSAAVKAGDIVAVREKSKALEVIEESLRANRVSKYSWLEWDAATMSGKFLNVPERSDIPENIKEQLIVELYSK